LTVFGNEWRDEIREADALIQRYEHHASEYEPVGVADEYPRDRGRLAYPGR